MVIHTTQPVRALSGAQSPGFDSYVDHTEKGHCRCESRNLTNITDARPSAQSLRKQVYLCIGRKPQHLLGRHWPSWI